MSKEDTPNQCHSFLLLASSSRDSAATTVSAFFLSFRLSVMDGVAKDSETMPALPSALLERRVHQRQRTSSIIKSKLKQGVSCTAPRVRSTLTGFFPVVRWLPKYKLREYVWGDLMSGMIVGIILVPQAIAYCLLAGVDPIYGLYTSFYANIIYFLMGTSRHVSVGIFSLMSLMVGQVGDHLTTKCLLWFSWL